MRLQSLLNHPSKGNFRFNANGYRRWMTDNLTIVDKDKVEVPLVPQPAQDDLLDHMSNHLLILVLKARKMGFSSLCLAVAVDEVHPGQEREGGVGLVRSDRRREATRPSQALHPRV